MRTSLALVLAVAAAVATVQIAQSSAKVVDQPVSILERPLRTCRWYQKLCRFINPCWHRQECQDYPDAVCKADLCECKAEYYVGEEKIDCQEVPDEPEVEPEPEPLPEVRPGKACSPVLCSLPCLDGYVKDPNGCETCECVQSADRPGQCPAIASGEVSTCGIECSSDAACDEGEKCCSNGCGRICVQACSPVLCRINCLPFGGYARDASGCEICRCLSRDSNKVCPAIDEEAGGICVNTCEVDDDCNGDAEKCCSNGCGHTCVNACEPVRCRLFCEHGYETDENNCKICLCKSPPGCPALAGACRLGCPFGFEQDENGCEICSCKFPQRPDRGTATPFARRGRPRGECPSVEGAAGICVLGCGDDGDCTNGQRCCSNGCGRVCTPPCPPISLCRMHCPLGFLKDDNGCEICQCKRPIVKRGKCPAVADGVLGICANTCETDEDCDLDTMKCCSNGCGRACTTACSPMRCFLGCHWGFATNSAGCENCECLPKPADIPGQCPPALPEVTGGICSTECSNDAECQGDFKCCSNNCGQVCVPACPRFRCRISCPFGYLEDENGCRICECRQRACPRFMCRMHCPNGYAKDKNNCEICQCKQLTPGRGLVDVPRECPVIPASVGGICVEECDEDNPCSNREICCSNGCGHTCIEGCLPLFCRKTCPGGYARNERGCQVCQCMEGTHTCREVQCRMYCPFGFVKDEAGCDMCECSDRPSDGIDQVCPAVPEGVAGVCVEECSEQRPCSAGTICCSNGCGHVCTEGCPAVVCRLGCRNGYETDENNCPICQCKRRAIGRGLVDVPRECPVIPASVGGICVEECDEDNPCSNREICCSNGCGHTCIEGCLPLFCRKACPGGYARNERGCQICQCMEGTHTCHEVKCRMYCPFGFVKDEAGCDICECSDRPSDAIDQVCPAVPEGVAGVCVEECSEQRPCSAGTICCSNGCGHVCTEGCPNVVCRLGCRNGYQTDENNCPICQCKRRAFGRGLVDVPRECPVIPEGGGGICVEECSEENPCSTGEICCSNGCGHTCIDGCAPVMCRMHCPFGWARNEEGCEICQCKDRPDAFGPTCPAVQEGILGICMEECSEDNPCPSGKICCSNGCGHTCVKGCRPVLCRLGCRNGFAKDRSGCEICRCKDLPEITGRPQLPMVCPVVPKDSAGICVEDCSEHSTCDEGQLCCSNGCGHTCVQACPAIRCLMYCRYGWERDENNCEICRCRLKTDICEPLRCRLGCRNGYQKGENGCTICKCRSMRRPFSRPRPEEALAQRVCPTVPEGMLGLCVEECGEETTCANGQICCSNGCGHTCVEGCHPVLCRLHCEQGWAKDEQGCEICSCAAPPPKLQCPAVPEGVLGICVEDCSSDSECELGQQCCSNGCGHACVEACRPVLCYMYCRNGWARDERGCEICQCAPETPIEVELQCPEVPEGILGICVEECSADSPCSNEGEMCCSNGCGHACTQGCRPVRCRMKCPQGFARNERGCEICQCYREKACPRVSCGLTGCQNGLAKDENGCETCHCNPPPEDLVCPALREGVLGICVDRCIPDTSCGLGQLCCSNGCGHQCMTGCTPINCLATIICEHGFATDENGCQTCRCNPPPPVEECPQGKEYQECGTACPQTCEIHRTGEVRPCILLCVPGCFCPTGTLQDSDGTCVQEQHCGCLHDADEDGSAEYHQIADVFRVGVDTCQCNQGGEVTCKPANCPIPLCRPTIDCPYGRRNDEHGCLTCICNPPPVETCEPLKCRIGCRFGFKMENGCPICGCNDPPEGITGGCEPVKCRIFCTYGFARDENGCETCECNPPPDVVCTDGKVYEECGSACPPTCQSIRSESEKRRVCPAMCVQGCSCPSGTVLDSDGMCVRAKQCGCLYDSDGNSEDEYYQLGESFTIGKRSRCQCRRNGRVMCSRKKPRRS